MGSDTPKQPTPLQQLGIEIYGTDMQALRYTAIGEEAARALEIALYSTEADLQYTERELAAYSDRLARDMADVAKALADPTRMSSLNTLGAVQGSGNRIDNLVGKLATLREELGRLVGIAKPLLALVDDAARVKATAANAERHARNRAAQAEREAKLAKQCTAKVYTGGGFRGSRCSKQGKVEVEGTLYCKQHARKQLERATWVALSNQRDNERAGNQQAAADFAAHKERLEAQLAAL